jgi:predicted transglutaminase-like cysteine proteinase
MLSFERFPRVFVSSNLWQKFYCGWSFIILLGGVDVAGAQTPVSANADDFSARPREVSTGAIRGWVDFCRREPADCAVNTSEPLRIKMTSKIWATIQSVNSQVNRSIKQRTDREIYRADDVWTIPYNGEGDCEDFQLLKRRNLVQKGLPARAMRMTVVVDEKGEGHAVLTILTDKGDYVLDNKTSRITTVKNSRYRFVKRESQMRRGWISLLPGRTPATTANE